MSSSDKKPQVRSVSILGTGSAVPDRVLTNHDLEALVDTSDDWIVARTGIRERRIADDKTAASDLAIAAARRALESSGITADQLDTIVVCTVTADYQFPSTACLVQAAIGSPRAYCMDLAAACSGFLYGTEVARGLIGAGLANHVLVIGVEMLSKFMNWQDRGVCILFGDAAGAAVIGPCNGRGEILATYLGADGTSAELIELPAGGSRHPITHEAIDQQQHHFHMKGNEVFKLGVRGMEEACRRVLDRAGVTPSDVSLLVPHQANTRIIDATAQRLELPPERVYLNIQKYGNTSAASVPLALDEARREGRLREGDLVLMVAFGAGLTWGASLVRW